MIGKALAGAAFCMLALGSFAWGENSSPGSSALQPAPVPLAVDDDATTSPSSAAPVTPIMQTPFGDWLAKYHLNLTGFVEAGYFHDLTKPTSSVGVRTLAGDHVGYPGAFKDQIILDEIDLAFSRSIDASKGFDVGFMIEGTYGRDSFFNHSNGIFDNNDKHGGGPNDQPDLQQAYLIIGIPVGTGLTINAGKFNALLGYEGINPTGNQFYTHNYIYNFGTPLSKTGITASYAFTDSITALAGITRGWSESIDDNNGAIDGLYQITYKANDKLTFTANGSFGPQGVPGTIPYGPKDNSNYWFVPELFATYQVSDECKIAVDGLYGFANRYSQWYAVSAYAGYTPDNNKYVTINGRIEWYDDGHGLTTGVPTTTNYGEATAGLQIKPFPDSAVFQFLQIRPEVRYDIADHSVFEGKAQQLSIAMDVLMQF